MKLEYIPIYIQKEKIRFICFVIFSLLLFMFDFDIEGRSIVESEVMMQQGNRMTGMAIPVNMPYILIASLLFRPYRTRSVGIRIDSNPVSVHVRILVSARG